jgi:hypothetical protein
MLNPTIPVTLLQEDFAQSNDLRVLRVELAARLRAGSHLILYGPRGVGKSTLIGALDVQYRTSGTPCGLALHTAELRDIVAALADAYPDTDVEGLDKRDARVRLRLVADRTPGVLLLDHATRITTAMLGYLRRLRGGIAGALLVADVDSPRERERMRAWHAGALSIRMPLMPNRMLHRWLSAAIQTSDLPQIEPRVMRQITRYARGRIGWVEECIRRLQAGKYRQADRLHLAALCTDTEIALRESRRGPRLSRRQGQAHQQGAAHRQGEV